MIAPKVPFSLQIAQLKTAAGVNYTGTLRVMVWTNRAGGVYDSSVAFSNGAATINNLMLEYAGPDSLSVEIEGITGSQSLSIDIQPNPIITPSTVTPEVGIPFTLDISGAMGYSSNIELNAPSRIKVTSSNTSEGANLDGVVFDNDVEFTAGSGTATITLMNSGSQSLTIGEPDIMGYATIEVIVQ